MPEMLPIKKISVAFLCGWAMADFQNRKGPRQRHARDLSSLPISKVLYGSTYDAYRIGENEHI